MTGIEALPIIAGFLAVWLTAWINNPETSPSAKRWTAIAVATMLGFLSLVVNGQITELPADALAWVDKIIGYIGLAIVASQGFYQVLWTPAKKVEAVTSGVAFLAAGMIVFSRGEVRGLTTGAGMWLAGAVGLSVGLGYWFVGFFATLACFIVLFMLGKVEQRYGAEKSKRVGEE